MELPDFEDMVQVSEMIAETALQKGLLEIQIKVGECSVFKQPVMDQNGKPASTSFIENAYKYTGLTGELIELRQNLAKLTADLEMYRSSLDLMKSEIEVWRSEQASARIALV